MSAVSTSRLWGTRWVRGRRVWDKDTITSFVDPDWDDDGGELARLAREVEETGVLATHEELAFISRRES